MGMKSLLITSFIFILTAALSALEQGTIIGWGSNTEVVEPHEYFGQATTPDSNDFIAIAAGLYHSIALKSDGSIAAWGADYYDQVGTTPSGNNFIAIAAGDDHNVAIRSDHSLIDWGDDYWGQLTNTPTGNDFIDIAAGSAHSIALRSNGTIAAWGDDYYDQVTDAPTSGYFIAIACGADHCLVIAANQGSSQGYLVGWGRNTNGIATPPAGIDYIAVAAGYNHSLALRSDGTLAAWGDNTFGQCNIPSPNSDFIAIAAGRYHNIAMKSDYSLVSWGRDNENEVADTPASTNFVTIAGGGFHSLALDLNCLYQLQGDFDNNCRVNLEDYRILASAWLSGYTLSDVQTMMSNWLINCRQTPTDSACIPFP